MVVQNQTNDTVNWTQSGTGGGPGEDKVADPESSEQGGTLNPKGSAGSSTTFTPTGDPPWTVCFSDATHPKVCATDITNANATVTLDSDWQVSVT